MVNEITPTYYASGNFNGVFELSGTKFELIPNDAVLVMSNDNDDPMKFKDRLDFSNFISNLETRSEGYLKYSQIESYDHGTPCYAAIIVSPDRNTVYWVNTTKPLP